MDKRAAIEIVSRFQRSIEARGITLQKIILYGSFAAGTNTAASDIDLVVISKDFAGKSYWERIDILTDAIYEVFEPVEAIAMTPEEWESGDSFITDFASNGEILYAA
jgi:predicted nucleotidyltransferase